MALYRRGDVYWIRIAVGGSRPTRESTRTANREQAQEYHDRRAAELWRVHRLGERPRVALADAALDWLTTHSVHKRSHETDRLRLAAMLPYLPDAPLDAITTGEMVRIRDRLRAERALPDRRTAAARQDAPRPPRRLTPATVNRYLAILSAILHHAHRREWLAAVPHVPMYKVERRAVPMLTPDAVAALLAALPDHLRDMAIMALATGLRQANVRLLRWDQVDLGARVARVPPAAAKAGETIVVPLSDDAVAVLQARLGTDPTWVFTYHGAPIGGKLTNSAWKRATAEVGLAGFRWHDLRHVWATWLAAAGVPESVRQTWGGWKTAGMARRYTHLAGSDLVPWANAVRLPSTNRAQSVGEVSGHSLGEPCKSVGWLTGLEPATTGITKRRAGGKT